MQAGGVLLVAPEQRMSLLLKWHDLRQRGEEGSDEICSALDALAALGFQDLLDESDELLHHRWTNDGGTSGKGGIRSVGDDPYDGGKPGSPLTWPLDCLPSHLNRFQLVYACGTSEALPAVNERAIAMQALLHALSDLVDSGRSGLLQNDSAVWIEDPHR